MRPRINMRNNEQKNIRQAILGELVTSYILCECLSLANIAWTLIHNVAQSECDPLTDNRSVFYPVLIE